MIQSSWFLKCFIPHLLNQRSKTNYSGRAILLLDGFTGHKSKHFMSYAAMYNVMVMFIPPHTSHIVQTLDLGFFAALKSY